MLSISNQVEVPENEVTISAVRSQGAGGQNVNKVSTAVHLRFDVLSSSLPEFYKKRLLKLNDARISKDGVIVIKAQRYRSQAKNRADALERLADLIRSVKTGPKKRVPTRPSPASQKKRLDEKSKHGRLKQLRKRTAWSDD